MSNVAAQFIVKGVVPMRELDNENTGQSTVRLEADIHSDNGEWAKYTPAGILQMSVKEGEALEFFKSRIDQPVRITFSVPD